MAKRTLALLVPLAWLLVSDSALAFDFGVGLEGVGTLSVVPAGLASGTVTSGGGGLILEERFSLVAVELTLWEDIQTPLQMQRTDGEPSSYVPVDLGLRVGLGSPLIKPYLGLLVNDSILSGAGPLVSSGANGLSLNSNIPGLGGDLGADLAVAFLRFGLEIRGYTTLSSVESGGSSFSPFVLQGLASARFSF